MNIKALARTYPIDKPRPSIQLVLLAVITIFGLTALFFAAFASFQISTGNVAQAFFAAILIEVGLAVEAMALIKRPKSPFPWIGLILAFLVSGVYNWYQVEIHTQPNQIALSPVVLLALALGPLSALAAVSLTLGNEIREYQILTGNWQIDMMKWTEKERKRLERAESQQIAYRKLPETPKQEAVNLPEITGNNLPAWLPVEPQNIGHFRQLVENGDVILPPGLTGKSLVSVGAVNDDRTGRNWLQSAGYRQANRKGERQ